MVRHKKNNPMADHIRRHAERYGTELSEKLRSGRYRFHDCRNVTIHDSYKGKTRGLQIPVLEDQSAEQAWLIIAIPILMKRGYYYSCSSIPGAGSGRAVRYIQRRLRGRKAPTWGCTTDIKKFFESCPHWVVRRGLRRIFKDRRFIDFASQCMISMHPNGVGIAIGHPISPWLANVALTELDFMLKEYYPETSVVRYMDDVLFLGRNKRKLKKAVLCLRRNLLVRGMKLKNSWQIRPLAKNGVAFLSYRFYPGYTTLQKKLMFRIARKMRKCDGGLSLHNARSVVSYLGILKHCDSFTFRQNRVYPYVNPQQCRRMISHADDKFRKQRNSQRVCDLAA